jgi:alkylated DNA nucleotide flippase Atl1
MVAARTSNVRPAKSARPAPRQGAATRRGSTLDWDAKLRPDLQPAVVADRRGTGTLLLPTPLVVGEAVAAIPRGDVTTFRELRNALARRFQADSTCPLMTGIFATILAGAVADDLKRSRSPRWPIWRLVRDDGTLHPKWPLDSLYRATILRQEGVRLTRRNGHWAAILTHHP